MNADANNQLRAYSRRHFPHNPKDAISQCVGKTPFHSHETAAIVAMRYGGDVYQCSFCGEYHLAKAKHKDYERGKY